MLQEVKGSESGWRDEDTRREVEGSKSDGGVKAMEVHLETLQEVKGGESDGGMKMREASLQEVEGSKSDWGVKVMEACWGAWGDTLSSRSKDQALVLWDLHQGPHNGGPMADKVKAYAGSFLCTNKESQPFAPRHVGEPGVILFPPGPSSGTIAPTPRSMQWRSDLMSGTHCQGHIWFRYIQKSAVAMSDVQVRCSLCKTVSSKPSPAEIQEWLRKYNDRTVIMERNVIPNSFNSGAEFLALHLRYSPSAKL
ncbi:hypothetical protein EDB84DRAFT_1442738 [Lactarius hengduanensis]|nr:hypothetical protein EDB84DRAFT_1442738 [Lactarius hengduanensis]